MAEELSIHDMSLEYVIGHLRSTLKNITYFSCYLGSETICSKLSDRN